VSASHQTERFSEALDRMLSSSQQRDFDEHLAKCEACSSEFEQYSGAIAKVRALPLAKMPTPVRIPADLSPRTSRLDGILGYFKRGRGAATAVGLLAAAGLLLVASRQTSTTSQATALKPAVLTPALSPISGGQAQAGSAALAAPKPNAAFSCAATLLPANGPAVPSTYSDVVTVSGNSGSSTRITVAVPSATVHAGDTIAVYARATVALQSVGSPGSSPSAPIAIGPCIQTSTSATAQAVNSSSLANVKIPSTSHPGDKVTVVAIVPAGSGGIATLPDLQATLTLTVQ
jgi:hypothetical protein